MARKATPKPQFDPRDLRPRLDHKLTGHNEARTAFVDALHGGRLHNGWLLHGEKGIGKATFALHALAYLVAEKARADDKSMSIDKDHPEARLIAQGAHPDVFWLDRATGFDGKKLPKSIPVSKVRETLQKLQSTPAYGGWRALVIDSVDDLNVEGANALLKPLEEPPKNTLIFLVAHRLNAVLPTIRSRCRHIALPSLDEPMVHEIAAQSLGDTVDPGSQDLTIKLAGGSAGRMQMLVSAPLCLEAFAHFCDIAGASHSKRSDQLALANTINAMPLEEQDLVFSLIEQWMSRRLRDQSEPIGLPSPQKQLSQSGKMKLAEFWSEQLSALAVRRAINLDVSERVMALFAQLDHVYSQQQTS